MSTNVFFNQENRDDFVKTQLHKIAKGSRILDAGAGEQRYKQYCSHLSYVSQDFAQYNGEGDGHGLQTNSWNYGKLDIIGDISNIPEPNASFDVVLCTEVLEHLPHPERALAEFSRLLKKKGVLILTAPFASLTHFAPYHYVSGFNRYYYLTLLKELGFSVETIKSNGNYFSYLIQEIYRLPSVSKKYTGVKQNIFVSILQSLMIRWLKWLAVRDQGSDELLCFGYHIVAKKTV